MLVGPCSAHEIPDRDARPQIDISTFLCSTYARYVMLYCSVYAYPSYSPFRCSPSGQHSKLADMPYSL